MADQGHYNTIEEVADRLQVSDQTIRRWIKSGRLPAYKPGREWRIKTEDLERFLETRSSPKVRSPSPLEPTLFNGGLDEERRKRFRDLANNADRLYTMLAVFYNSLPVDPSEEDLESIERELSLHATYFLNFLDDLNEEGTTREVVEFLEGEDDAGAVGDEIRRLHGSLGKTLRGTLPSCTRWLIEQSKRYTDEAPSNVISLEERRTTYEEPLQLKEGA